VRATLLVVATFAIGKALKTMGPNLLVDKSALQMLSQDELYRLFIHFNLVTCNVLLIEILGDLKKWKEDERLSEMEVQRLANKLVDAKNCAPHTYLALGNLLGHSVPMTGQVPLAGGKPVTVDGETGVFFDVSPENQAIRRWKAGEFSEAEKALAETWRKLTADIDLEGFQRTHKGQVRKFKNLDNLHRFICHVSRPKDTEGRRRLLVALLGTLQIPVESCPAVFSRWEQLGQPDIEEFAPYAYYCFKITQVFKHAVVTRLISPRKTNQVDMNYLYYLPFCYAFCSRDNLHRDLVLVFLRHDQSFIHGDELKADLKRLNCWWASLTEEERSEHAYEYGSRPPFDDASVTHREWRKHMRPWTPGSGNRTSKMSKEEKEAILKKVRRIVEAADRESHS
jgi:hypothetical protein